VFYLEFIAAESREKNWKWMPKKHDTF
jgi:hypothetical protein